MVSQKSDSRRKAIKLAARNRTTDTHLGVNTIDTKTETLYRKQMFLFEAMLASFGACALDEFLELGAAQALGIWALLFLQVGFDSQLLGVTEAGQFIRALKRHLLICLRIKPIPPFAPELVLQPLWQSFKHWRKLEPYEFRLPIPLCVLWALMGVGIACEDFRFSACYGRVKRWRCVGKTCH